MCFFSFQFRSEGLGISIASNIRSGVLNDLFDKISILLDIFLAGIFTEHNKYEHFIFNLF